MTPKYMLDTNICIYLIKHQPIEVAERFAQCFVGEVVISSVTLAELEYGVACAKSAGQKNQKALDRLLEDIPVVSFDAQAAKTYGPIRLATRDRKQDALDKLIAAHALALGVILVTNNETDFSVFPGLKIENWVHRH